MRKTLQSCYSKIGIHNAEPGTVLHYLHHVLRAVAGRAGRAKPPPHCSDLDGLKQELAASGVIVAFRVTGGLGDNLIAARYIRDLLTAVGPFRFDVYSSIPMVAEWVFSEFPECNSCQSEFFQWDERTAYPLAMFISTFVIHHSEHAHWRSVPKKLRSICGAMQHSRPDIEPYIQQHPRFDAYMAQEAVLRGVNRYTFAHEMSGINYGGDLLSLPKDPSALDKFDLKGRRYITIHNGFDDSFRINGRATDRSTKVYPHFAKVVALLRAEHPDLYIVQLGTKTSHAIAGIDLNLLCNTSLAQTAAILADSWLHIDNEGGLVHMAACLGVTSCVLFGPTNPDFFAYKSNINIRPNFCGNCWWHTPDWMANCPRGFSEPRCLSDQPPEAVANAISRHLSRTDHRLPMSTRKSSVALHILQTGTN